MKICVKGYCIYKRNGEWTSPPYNNKLLFDRKTLLVNYKTSKTSLF